MFARLGVRQTLVHRAAAWMVTAVFLLALAACGGGGDEAGGSEDGAAEEGSGSQSVNWWGWAPGKDLADEYLAEFEKEHPDIKVVYKEVPYGEYVNALRLGLRSDSGPDVFALQPGEITDRFGPSGVDLSSFGSDWESDVVGDSHEQFARDGKQVGMPVQLSASGIAWYNKTVFDEYELEPPTNAEELSQVCDTLAAEDIVCMAQGAQDAWANIDFYMALAADTAPGVFYEAVDGETPWTDPGLVEAFELWQQMFEDGVFGEGSAGLAVYPDTVAQFSGGEAGMIMLGTWQAGFMDATHLEAAQDTEEYDPQVILPMAFPDMDGDGQQPKPFGGPDYGLAINADSDAQEASWTFVEWLSATEEGQSLIGAEKFVPALEGVPLSDDDLVEPSVQEPALDQVIEYMAESEGYREIPYAEIKTALGEALANVAVGQQTPEQAAEAVEAVSAGMDRE